MYVCMCVCIFVQILSISLQGILIYFIVFFPIFDSLTKIEVNLSYSKSRHSGKSALGKEEDATCIDRRRRPRLRFG